MRRFAAVAFASGWTGGVLTALVGLVIALAAAGVVPGDAASSRQAAAWIAFSSSRSESGRSELYLMRADGTGERRLTTTRDPEIENPTWSPRGRQIAFEAGRTVCRHGLCGPRHDIYVVDADGSGLRRLTRNGVSTNPDWSRDGRQIVFVRDATTLATMNADGSGLRTVFKDKDGEVADPSWSPDGRRIAFDSYVTFTFQGYTSDAQRISIVKADGTGRRRIVISRDPTDHVYDSEPDWSPDGQRIAFTENFDCACESELQSYDVELVNLNRMGYPVGKWRDLGSGENPSWSPDEAMIVYETAYVHPTALNIMDARGKLRYRLTKNPRWNFEPAWSP